MRLNDAELQFKYKEVEINNTKMNWQLDGQFNSNSFWWTERTPIVQSLILLNSM